MNLPQKSDDSWMAALSYDEVFALLDYTQTGYLEVNQALLLGHSQAVSQKIALLDSALSKAPDSNEQVLYRAQRFYDPVNVGGELTIAPYLSTSADPSKMGNYLSESNNTIFEIYTSKGVDINALSAKEGRETEFLIRRNSAFRVHGVYESKWISRNIDHEAGVSFDFCHSPKVRIIQLEAL